MPRRAFLFCILLLVLATLYTLASAWITVGRIARLDAAGNATAQSQQVLSALHAFATAAVDLESSARGYALTGSDPYLRPFDTARRQAPQRLDELRDLLRADTAQLARIEQLTPLLAERIAISEHAIAQKRTAPDEPFVMRFGRGRETSDEIRRIVEDIESDERHALASRKMAWQQELESARTTEALSALTSFTVITLSLWALLRLRRAETAPARAEPVAPPAPVTSPVAEVSPDYDSLVDATLRRAALLQASHPAGSAERARVELLREAIENARSGVAASDALAVIERLGLSRALSAMARTAQERERCTVRESIDDSTPIVAPSLALLLLRAAGWAVDVLCAQRPSGEIGIGLAHDEAHVVVRVESPLRAAAPLDTDHEARATRLSQQIVAAGGSWQWSVGEAGQSLTAMVPAPESARPPSVEHESARA